MAGDDSSRRPFDDDATAESDDEDGRDEDRDTIDLSVDVDDEVAGDVDGGVGGDVDGGVGGDVDGGAVDEVAGDPADDVDDAEPFEALDADAAAEDPFAELDADARDAFPDAELAGASGEGDGEADPFEEMEVEDLDEEDVWAALSEAEEAAVDLGGEATPVETEEGVEDHIVDKREYCQQCPYFTEPPTVSCEHEGTDIVEVVSADEFRVRGCPMIGEEGPTFRGE